MNDSRIPFPKWAEPIKNKIEAVHSRYHSTVIDLQNTTMGGRKRESERERMKVQIINEHHKLNMEYRLLKVLLFSISDGIHDTNIMALGRSLKIPEISDSLVAYAAHLTVELHMINGIKYIELWFAGNVTNKRKQVLIPECGNPCPMMKLQEITKNDISQALLNTLFLIYLPCVRMFQGRRPTRNEMVMECRGIGIIGEQSGVLTGIEMRARQNVRRIFRSMILVLGILVLSTLILLCTTCSYRKQLKNLQDPERRSLLNTNS
uniref:Transmembrane protein n=1 Tax=Heterorhabditis bacteriophora TaxID=37862 RepID=A0A1I7X6S8_HETBA